MGTMHKYYEPNEWDQMLIAAGFAKPETFDEDYQKYLRDSKYSGDETMDYDQWNHCRREWDRMNAEWEKEFPDQFATLTPAQEKRQHELLRDMMRFEMALGY
jgi:hypothetical protein